MKGNSGIKDINVGIVGLGLMGSSIVASLLVAGHTVKAIAPLPGEKSTGSIRIKDQVVQCKKCNLLTEPVDHYLSLLSITEDYSELNSCSLVVECVIEDTGIKQTVFGKILAAVSSETIIATNTSAIPISFLQQFITVPERFIGIHWAEPAYATRFLEIICGEQTSPLTADWIFELAHQWGKEPTLLRKDIRGFITNRLMYSIYREALSLIDKGHASVEDADKALRYDAGSWMTLMGIFRRMEYMGLQDHLVIFKALFPKLSNMEEVPPAMQHLVAQDARGVQNNKGFYKYTNNEAKYWEEAFASFNEDIYRLAAKYPSESLIP